MEKKLIRTTDEQWELLQTFEEKHGRCIECNERVWINVYTYLNPFTKRKRHIRERSTCSCDL